MSDDPGVSEDTNETSRWTCEACGCNTNSEDDNPLSCGVCGTRRGKLVLSLCFMKLLCGVEEIHVYK